MSNSGREQRLAGRFALITGAAGGIGRAVAERFAAEGATVAINHREGDDKAAAALAAVQAIAPAAHRLEPADVSDPLACTALVERVVGAFGRLDILVNNAGTQAEAPSEAYDDARMQQILALNLIGPASCARAAIRHFLSRPGGGVIINNSSVHQIIPKPGFLAYSMSKGGLGNLTRTLALEFADRAIRVNAVAPGATLTAMNDAWANDPSKRQEVESHIPMRRAATPEEMAPAFAFLASDESAYITGQTLYVDGGLTLYGDFKQNWSS